MGSLLSFWGSKKRLLFFPENSTAALFLHAHFLTPTDWLCEGIDERQRSVHHRQRQSQISDDGLPSHHHLHQPPQRRLKPLTPLRKPRIPTVRPSDRLTVRPSLAST